MSPVFTADCWMPSPRVITGIGALTAVTEYEAAAPVAVTETVEPVERLIGTALELAPVAPITTVGVDEVLSTVPSFVTICSVVVGGTGSAIA